MNYEQIAIWSQVLSAIAFLVVVVYLFNKFILPVVIAGQEAKNRQIADSERHRDEAKAALDLLHNEIDGADRDAASIRQRAQEQGEHEKATVLTEAREAGERALRSAEGELERARAAARQQLRTRLLDKALDIAKNDAKQRVDSGMNAKLVGGFVASLERENAHG